MYAELLKHGLDTSFDSFWRAFISDSYLTFRERWHFASDYSKLLAGSEAVFGRENIIARLYRRSDSATDILDDFMPIILPTWCLDKSKYRVNEREENNSLPVTELAARRANNRAGASPLDAERSLVGPFQPLRLRDLVQATLKLTPANFRLWRRFGVLIPPVSGRRFHRMLKSQYLA